MERKEDGEKGSGVGQATARASFLMAGIFARGGGGLEQPEVNKKDCLKEG